LHNIIVHLVNFTKEIQNR